MAAYSNLCHQLKIVTINKLIVVVKRYTGQAKRPYYNYYLFSPSDIVEKIKVTTMKI